MSEAAADRIRVAVVDDHEMFRAGVIATLRDSFDLSLIHISEPTRP